MIDPGTKVVLVGTCLLGACSGIVGTFAVLRKRALAGDALAHATLPGVCLAFLAVGQRSLPALLLGALVSGLAGVLTITALRRFTRLKEDAAIGFVLGAFTGLGFALLRMIQGRATGDTGAGLKDFVFGRALGMGVQDVQLIRVVAILCLGAVVLFYKEFRLVSFDPGFARVQGWPALALDLGLMALLAVTVVIGLSAVGAVLMAALLIVPAAAARFWTDRLGVMLVLSAGFGAVAGGIGTFVSSRFSNMPTGPVIVLVATVFFLVSLFASPRRGLIAGWLARIRFRHELEERYLLLVLYELSEPRLPGVPPLPFEAILTKRSWTPRHLAGLLSDLARKGYVHPAGTRETALTEEGLRRAVEVARGQRLWALCLTEYPELAAGVVDLASESVEGVLPEEMIEELKEKLRRAGRWPEVQPA